MHIYSGPYEAAKMRSFFQLLLRPHFAAPRRRGLDANALFNKSPCGGFRGEKGTCVITKMPGELFFNVKVDLGASSGIFSCKRLFGHVCATIS
jgi:hypothetical protein